MQSITVNDVLKIYNILRCGRADEPKYKETLFYKSVNEDNDALISILNGELHMKSSVDLSKKFGFFEGNKRVYELFGHAFRRIVDTYGSEFLFKEEDMLIHDDEEIKENDYMTITTFFNMKTGMKYTKDRFTQEVSARDLYLHIYAEKYNSFAYIIQKAHELREIAPKIYGRDKEFKEMQEKLNSVNEELKESKTRLLRAETKLKEAGCDMKMILDNYRREI